MTEKGPSSTHVTTIEGDDLGLRYWPSCSCGWAPYAQMSHTDAKRLCRTHKALMKPGTFARGSS